MRRKTIWLGIAAACLAAGVPQPVQAQESILMRYRPQPRTRMHTLWRTISRNTLREGAPGVPALDSIMVETHTLTSLTTNVREAQFTRFVVDVTHDSTRARTRATGGAWRDIPELKRRTMTAQITVDDRLRVLDAKRTRGDTLTLSEEQQMRAFLSGLEFALPEQPVTVGDTVTSDIVLQVDRPLGFGSATPMLEYFQTEPEIVVRSTLTLDSLLPRDLDTLAFLTVRGQFVPTEVDASTEEVYVAVTVTGAFGGSLIWSTGWNAFVSGAVRTRTTQAVEYDPLQPGDVAMTMEMDRSTSFQVRP